MALVAAVSACSAVSPVLRVGDSSSTMFGDAATAQLDLTTDEVQDYKKQSCSSQCCNSSLASTDTPGHHYAIHDNAMGLNDKNPTYEVDIVDREDVFNLLSPTLYKVRVAGPHGVHFVWHRFHSFTILDRHMRPLHPALPYMPTKGMFCKLDDGFLDRRQERLQKVLQQMVAADPQVNHPILRRFLGIDGIDAGGVPKEICTDSDEEDEDVVWVMEVEVDSEAPAEAAMPSSSSCAAAFPSRLASPRHSKNAWSTSGGSSPRNWGGLCSSPKRGRKSLGTSPHRPHGITPRRCSSQDVLPPKCRPSKAESCKPWCSSPRADDSGFREMAVIIARDVARVFGGDSRVDDIRLQIAEVLRSYARMDPEIGYVQGMCFAAAVICLEKASSEAAHRQFGELMSSLRELWLPGFPMLSAGTHTLEALIAARDPELHAHFGELSLELMMILPGAWMSVFAKWLPLRVLMDIVPFLISEGVVGFLAVTFVVILHHREALLKCSTLDEVLPYVNNLFSQPPPEDLLGMCKISLPAMEAAAKKSVLSL